MSCIKSIYYHNPSPRGFERMICYYKARNYSFLSIDKLFALLKEGKKINGRYVFISFDDGWKGNLNLVPIIEKYRVPICIFVATEPLHSGNFWWEYITKERGLKQMLDFKKLPYEQFTRELSNAKRHIVLRRSSLTCEELLLLCKNELISIQSHTVNHPILTSLPNELLEIEMAESKKQLEQLTGEKIFAFSYPNGSLNQREVEVCSKYYCIAFSTIQNNIELNDNIYMLPRYALTGDYYRDLLKVWGVWKHLKKIKDLINCH